MLQTPCNSMVSPNKSKTKDSKGRGKGKTITLRLTDDDHAAWSAAAALDQRTLSSWIRARCVGAAATAPAAPPAEQTKRRSR